MSLSPDTWRYLAFGFIWKQKDLHIQKKFSFNLFTSVIVTPIPSVRAPSYPEADYQLQGQHCSRVPYGMHYSGIGWRGARLLVGHCSTNVEFDGARGSYFVTVCKLLSALTSTALRAHELALLRKHARCLFINAADLTYYITSKQRSHP